jgi:hypothetical protein
MSRASPLLALCVLTILLLSACPLFTSVAWAVDHASHSDVIIVQEGGSTTDQGDPDELDSVGYVRTLAKLPPTKTGGDVPDSHGVSSLGWAGEFSLIVQLLSVIP